MNLTPRSEAPSATRDGNTYTPLAGGREALVIHTRKEPGAATMAHSHDREEIVVILAGSGEFTVGDEAASVTAGDTIVVPAGEVHQLTVGDEAVEALLVKPRGIGFFSPDGSQMPTPDWMPS
jgi:quercetin dioxygenase-like cupin family protein